MELKCFIRRGDFVRFCELIENGGKHLVNEKDEWDGETPLHSAARSGNAECMQALFFHGANVMEKDNYGKTVLHWAVWKKSNLECIRMILNNGGNHLVNEKDKRGQTPLHFTIWNDLDPESSIQLLLEEGVDIDETDELARTPFHYAAIEHNLKCIRAFIRYGASILIKDVYGKTPVDYYKGNKEEIQKWIEEMSAPEIKEPDDC